MTNKPENKLALDITALKHLSDEVLVSKIKNLAAVERKLTQVMIAHIAEVDRRKLHLKMAYSSLYDYLTQEIGYSEGAAQRRIDAARLLQSVPELAQKIETGSIKLSQVSHIQKICRQIKKESGQPVTTETKQILLQKVENKNSATTQTIIAQTLNISPLTEPVTRKTFQAEESVRVELTFSKEEFEILKQAQALLSNKTGGSLKDAILEMSQALIKKTKSAETSKSDSKIKNSTPLELCFNSPLKQSSTATAAVTFKTKKLVQQRDQCCQFKDKNTGKICGAKYFLEVDHIQPRFADGDNSFENLRILCRNHNQFRYKAGL